MITLRVQNDYNEKYAPAGAKKAYIARITGRDTFAREFVGKEVMIDEPGLYELRSTDKKGRADDSYVLVLDCLSFPTGDGGTLRTFDATKEQAMTIAKALDAGRAISGIAAVVDASSKTRSERTWEILSAKKAETRQAAQGIDSATEQCWGILSTLTETEAKKVLAALRQRISPPKLKAAADAPVADAPVAERRD